MTSFVKPPAYLFNKFRRYSASFSGSIKPYTLESIPKRLGNSQRFLGLILERVHQNNPGFPLGKHGMIGFRQFNCITGDKYGSMRNGTLWLHTSKLGPENTARCSTSSELNGCSFHHRSYSWMHMPCTETQNRTTHSSFNTLTGSRGPSSGTCQHSQDNRLKHTKL